jgi:hypothetical protein
MDLKEKEVKNTKLVHATGERHIRCWAVPTGKGLTITIIKNFSIDWLHHTLRQLPAE